jgi:uncharacterized protein YecE (DUF72 family)
VKAEVLIGPAGWSYPDWNGVVYPSKQPRGFDPLVFMASYFNLIEINSTFYRVPERRTCARWTQRIAHRDDFRFTVKVFREITHGKKPASERNVAEFKTAVEPIAAADRLSRLLVQFPWSFRFNRDTAAYVRSLHEWFLPMHTSFEVRHGSWGSNEAKRFFRDHHLNMCCIDQPLIGDSLRPDCFNLEDDAGYFRLHGQNRAEWFKAGTNRDLRYNYFYSREAMVKWSERIREAAQRAHRIHVVLNNHFRGQAVANALELMATLEDVELTAPSTLIGAYPRLSAFLKRAPSGNDSDQPSLFDDQENQH